MKAYGILLTIFLLSQTLYAQENSDADFANPYLKPFYDTAVATTKAAKEFPRIIQTQLDSFHDDLANVTSIVSSIGSMILKSAESALSIVAQNLNDYVSGKLELAANDTSGEVVSFVTSSVSIISEADDCIESLHEVYNEYIKIELENATEKTCYRDIFKKLNATTRNAFKVVFTCASDRANEVNAFIMDFNNHLLASDEKIRTSISDLKTCIDGLSSASTDAEQAAAVSCILSLTASTIEAYNSLTLQTTAEAANVTSSIQKIKAIDFPACRSLDNTVNQYNVFEFKELVEACKAS